MDKIRKELNLLQKLYGLYNNVMDSVDSYYDIQWTNVDTEKINTELLDFQNKYKDNIVTLLSFIVSCDPGVASCPRH